MTIIPAPEDYGEPKASNVRLPPKRWSDLDDIAAHQSDLRGKSFSRNDVLDWFIKAGILKYWEEQSSSPTLEQRVQGALTAVGQAQSELRFALHALQEQTAKKPRKRSE